jgi:hypothetical protein
MDTIKASFDILEDDETHPLDQVENIMNANNWTFSRTTEDELMVTLTGRNGDYRLFFIWQEDMRALQLCVQYEISIEAGNIPSTRLAIGKINEQMWMGHFDLPTCTGTPTYRYTWLSRGPGREALTEALEDIVDISMAQCERHFPVFHLLSSANDISEKTLSLALMDTLGES